jgi:hypothetical protein
MEHMKKGDSVKIVLVNKERFWVTVLDVTKNVQGNIWIYGQVDNELVDIKRFKYGDTIVLPASKVIEVWR